MTRRYALVLLGITTPSHRRDEVISRYCCAHAYQQKRKPVFGILIALLSRYSSNCSEICVCIRCTISNPKVITVQVSRSLGKNATFIPRATSMYSLMRLFLIFDMRPFGQVLIRIVFSTAAASAVMPGVGTVSSTNIVLASSPSRHQSLPLLAAITT